MTGRFTSPRRRGFSLIETFVAMAVLSIGGAGAYLGLVSAAQQIKNGRASMAKALLADELVQQMMLDAKNDLSTRAFSGATPSGAPDTWAVGTAPWAAQGYFTSVDGQLVANTTIAPGTPCNGVAIPNNVFCRESMILRGAPPSLQFPAIPSGSQAYTLWVRVTQKNELLRTQTVRREVIIR